MPKSCIVCSVVASPDILLQYCAQCQSAMYCSKTCQRIDWRKKQHRQICKLLNVGHGDMQVRIGNHMNIQVQKLSEEGERLLPEELKRFFRLFEESTFEGSPAAAREMKKIARRQPKRNKKFLLFQSLRILVRSDLEMLSWPNSPLLVMLQFVDPSVLTGTGNEDTPHEGNNARVTLLHELAGLAAPSDYSTHEKQLSLAKQLIERGANVNAVSIPHRQTPLHKACSWDMVTNLDFVELLLEKGADPNSQDSYGHTPFDCTTPDAPGAAKFLLNWSTTDVNYITNRSGQSFLVRVRSAVEYFSDKIALPDNTDRVQHQFMLQQWRKIEEMLVERVAADTGITALS
jgi:hypothetical protein